MCYSVCCSVSHCVAVRVVVSYSVLQYAAGECGFATLGVLQCCGVRCGVHCSVLQCVAVCCS